MFKLSCLVNDDHLTAALRALTPYTSKIETIPVEEIKTWDHSLPTKKYKKRKTPSFLLQKIIPLLPKKDTILNRNELQKALGLFGNQIDYPIAILIKTKRIAMVENRRGYPGGSIYRITAGNDQTTTEPSSHILKQPLSHLTLAPVDTIMRGFEIANLLPSIGLSRRTQNWAIKKLIAAGRIKKVDTGQYKVLQTRGEA